MDLTGRTVVLCEKKARYDPVLELGIKILWKKNLHSVYYRH